MSLKLTDKDAFDEGTRKEVFRILLGYLPQLIVLSEQKIKEAYTSTFSKNPIDTGESQRNSIVTAQSQLRPQPFIKLIFESKLREPFLYFAEPLSPSNPNFKYGKRNTLVSARDKLIKQLKLK